MMHNYTPLITPGISHDSWNLILKSGRTIHCPATKNCPHLSLSELRYNLHSKPPHSHQLSQ